MTRPRPQFEPEPRVWSEHQVACRLGRDVSWLSDNRPQLEAAGFPAIDDLLGGTDADAVEKWVDDRARKPVHIADWVKIVGLAKWFGDSVPTLRRKLPSLYAEGFPNPITGINKWYLPACKEWAKGRSSAAELHDDPLMRALDGHRSH